MNTAMLMKYVNLITLKMALCLEAICLVNRRKNSFPPTGPHMRHSIRVRSSSYSPAELRGTLAFVLAHVTLTHDALSYTVFVRVVKVQPRTQSTSNLSAVEGRAPSHCCKVANCHLCHWTPSVDTNLRFKLVGQWNTGLATYLVIENPNRVQAERIDGIENHVESVDFTYICDIKLFNLLFHVLIDGSD